MSEYNFWLQVKCNDSKKIEVLKSRLKKDQPFPNISTPSIIGSNDENICLLWDVSVSEESYDENYDIGMLINFLFKEGIDKVYGLYQDEHDESGIGNFIFADKSMDIDPEMFELEDMVIYSGEERGTSIFKECEAIGSGDDLFDIDVNNILSLFSCISSSHEEGLLKSRISVSKGMGNGTAEIDIFTALYKGELSQVGEYIENGGDLDIKNSDGDGETPLMCAAEDGHIELCSMMIESGADVNEQNYEGETALMWAAQEGHDDICGLLIESGADMNHKDEEGQTALMLAAYEGYSEVIRLLLEAGADPNAESKHGTTPLSLASANKHYKIVKILENIQK